MSAQATTPGTTGGGGPERDAQRRANTTLVRKLAVIVVGMFGFGFLLVPLYEKICEVTGLRNIAQPDAVRSTQVDLTRSVRVEFDSNVRQLPWTFRPLTPQLVVHPGEVQQVVYEISNRTDRPMKGQAIPSYAPRNAAQYFKKLDCFCFAQQTLAPGEVRQMPVVFVIDPDAPADLVELSLSYTFFEVEGS